MTVEIPESLTVEFTLRLNRAGETDRYLYKEALANAIASQLIDSHIQTPPEVTA